MSQINLKNTAPVGVDTPADGELALFTQEDGLYKKDPQGAVEKIGGGSSSLSSVVTDDTLTGNGTTANPLSVVGGTTGGGEDIFSAVDNITTVETSNIQQQHNTRYLNIGLQEFIIRDGGAPIPITVIPSNSGGSNSSFTLPTRQAGQKLVLEYQFGSYTNKKIDKLIIGSKLSEIKGDRMNNYWASSYSSASHYPNSCSSLFLVNRDHRETLRLTERLTSRTYPPESLPIKDSNGNLLDDTFKLYIFNKGYTTNNMSGGLIGYGNSLAHYGSKDADITADSVFGLENYILESMHIGGEGLSQYINLTFVALPWNQQGSPRYYTTNPIYIYLP